MISIVALSDGSHAKLTKDIEHVKKRPVWIDIHKPTAEDMDFLEKHFGLDRLCLDDIKTPVLRPKIDNYDSYLFVVLHTVKLVEKRYRRVELDFVIGKDFLITSHYDNLPHVEAIKQRCEKEDLLSKLDILMYYLVSGLVDSYAPVMEKINEELSEFEKTFLNNPTKEHLNTATELQKYVVDMRRIAGPERETINQLTKPTYSFFSEKSQLYFRDAYDRIYRVTEQSDTFRELLASSLQVYFSMVSMKLNEVVELLTIIFTITIPPTIIGTFYGMNVVKIPLANDPMGFYAIIGISLAISGGMLLFFRKKSWV